MAKYKLEQIKNHINKTKNKIIAKIDNVEYTKETLIQHYKDIVMFMEVLNIKKEEI